MLASQLQEAEAAQTVVETERSAFLHGYTPRLCGRGVDAESRLHAAPIWAALRSFRGRAICAHKGKARVEEAREDTGRGPNCGPALTRGADHMASLQAGSLAVLLCFFRGSVFCFWFVQGLTASSSSPVLGAQPAWPIRMQSILRRTTQSKRMQRRVLAEGGPWVNRQFDPFHTVGKHVVSSLASRCTSLSLTRIVYAGYATNERSSSCGMEGTSEGMEGHLRPKADVIFASLAPRNLGPLACSLFSNQIQHTHQYVLPFLLIHKSWSYSSR